MKNSKVKRLVKRAKKELKAVGMDRVAFAVPPQRTESKS